MCDKAFLGNRGTSKSVPDYVLALQFVPDCYKTKEMCKKVANTSPSAIHFASNCYKTQSLCAKAVDTCSFVFDSVTD